MNQPSKKIRPEPKSEDNADGVALHDSFLSGEAAAALLGVKRQTLYAYASRGLLRSVPSGDKRAHLYSKLDLLRLKARSDARAGHGAVAAGALRWGEPVLETAISAIDPRGPSYRGIPAVGFVERGASFESVAEHLWGERDGLNTGADRPRWSASLDGARVRETGALLPAGSRPITALMVGVAALGAGDPGRFLFVGGRETALARSLIVKMAALLCLPDRASKIEKALSETSIARSILTAFGARKTPQAIRAIERTLVVCADHELNASTFAVRVAASAGADLYACMSVGLATLSGPEHGGVSDRIEALLAEAGCVDRIGDVIHERARRGEAIPGFGHTLYPKGDPRAKVLIAAADHVARSASGETAELSMVRGLVSAMEAFGQEAPTLDIGLCAVAAATGLPPGGAAALFAMGRAAGWVAHAMEQRKAGFLLRPRALYTGRLAGERADSAG